MPITIRVSLEEDRARGVLGGVHCNGKGGGEVWEMKDWFDRKRNLRVSNKAWHAGDQFQGRFFLVRSMRGRAMLE